MICVPVSDIEITPAERNGGLAAYYRNDWKKLPGIRCDPLPIEDVWIRNETNHWKKAMCGADTFIGHVDAHTDTLYLSGEAFRCSVNPWVEEVTLHTYRKWMTDPEIRLALKFVSERMILKKGCVATQGFVTMMASRYFEKTTEKTTASRQGFLERVNEVVRKLCCGYKSDGDFYVDKVILLDSE
jgi:hypothetical protein